MKTRKQPTAKLPRAMKAGKFKAVKMWSNGHFAHGGQVFVDEPTDFTAYYFLPATPEAVEAMVEALARSQCKLECRPGGERGYWGRHSHDLMRDARHNLASLNITNPATKEKE